MHRTAAPLVAGVTLVLVAGCSALEGEPSFAGRPGEAQVWYDDSSRLLRAETLEDWVTYGDHLVRVRVSGFEEGPLRRGDVDGLIPTIATIELDEVLWSNEFAAPPPEDFQLEWGGTIITEGEETGYAVIAGTVALVDQEFYLGMVSFVGQTLPDEIDEDTVIDPDGGEWILIDDSFIPAGGGVVGRGDYFYTEDGPYRPDGKVEEVGDRNGIPDALELAWGEPEARVVELLRSTPPDPDVAPYLDSPANARMRKQHPDATLP